MSLDRFRRWLAVDGSCDAACRRGGRRCVYFAGNAQCGPGNRQVDRALRRPTARYTTGSLARTLPGCGRARDFADSVAEGVGHVKTPGGIDRNAEWEVEPGERRKPEITSEARLGSTSRDDGRDHAPSVDHAHAVVHGIGDEEIAALVNGDAHWEVELRLRGLTAVSADTKLAISGNSRDHACCVVDFPHAIVERVGDIEIAARADRGPDRRVELCRRGRTAVSGETCSARPCDDGAVQKENSVVVRVDDIYRS